MKTLDRYVVRSFLSSYALWFAVLMGLRTVVDLFVNMDEFVKLDMPLVDLGFYVGKYYLFQLLIYFQELNGLIVVLAAAFSLARMNQTNELTAMLASGVSLHRVIVPVLLGGMLLGGLGIVNQELLIPAAKHRLVRDRDDVPGTNAFAVWLMSDGRRAVWWSRLFSPATAELAEPMIFIRDARYKGVAKLTGAAARYEGQGRWVFREASLAMAEHGARTTERVRTHLSPDLLSRQTGPDGLAFASDPRGWLEITAEGVDTQARRLTRPRFRLLGDIAPDGGLEVIATLTADYAVFDPSPRGDEPQYRLYGGLLEFLSDLDPTELALRQSSGWLDLMATRELEDLLATGKVAHPAAVDVLRHTRFTQPLANLLMLLVGLPFLLGRERNIKASAMLAVAMVGACYICVHGCRYLGGDVLSPILSAWLPILIFGPIAAIMLDSIKT